MDKQAENEGDCSKRIKLSTTKYLHKTRFEEGRGSDVKIIALNREWNLHKIFLEKSPYFQCMFSGPWIETVQREINIGIEDDNITTDALHKVFESLYIDEIQIEDTEVIPILACAILFQLDDLIDNCAEVMKMGINVDTVVPFLEVSDRYGIKKVKEMALDWLYRNCLYIFFENPSRLNLLSVDQMRELLTSPEMCMKDERHIFEMLLLFVFLKENSSENCDNYGDMCVEAENYFNSLSNEKAFLETDYGIKYQPLFRTLRLRNLILYSETERIEALKIIPKEWLTPVFQLQWYQMLRMYEGSDEGPKSEEVSEDDFNRECIRESGVIRRNTPWLVMKTFDFGFGLLYKYDNGFFFIMRKGSLDPVSLNNNKRNLMYRITLYSVDDGGRVLSKAETGLKTISLTVNDMNTALKVKPPMTFPIQYRFNFLFTTP